MPPIDEVDLAEKLSDHKHRIGSLEHRMDAAENVIQEIHDISTSVQLLAQESKSTGEKVDILTSKVTTIEKKPGEKAEKMKDSIILDLVKIIIGALLGAVLALILK